MKKLLITFCLFASLSHANKTPKPPQGLYQQVQAFQNIPVFKNISFLVAGETLIRVAEHFEEKGEVRQKALSLLEASQIYKSKKAGERLQEMEKKDVEEALRDFENGRRSVAGEALSEILKKNVDRVLSQASEFQQTSPRMSAIYVVEAKTFKIEDLPILSYETLLSKNQEAKAVFTKYRLNKPIKLSNQAGVGASQILTTYKKQYLLRFTMDLYEKGVAFEEKQEKDLGHIFKEMVLRILINKPTKFFTQSKTLEFLKSGRILDILRQSMDEVNEMAKTRQSSKPSDFYHSLVDSKKKAPFLKFLFDQISIETLIRLAEHFTKKGDLTQAAQLYLEAHIIYGGEKAEELLKEMEKTEEGLKASKKARTTFESGQRSEFQGEIADSKKDFADLKAAIEEFSKLPRQSALLVLEMESLGMDKKTTDDFREKLSRFKEAKDAFKSFDRHGSVDLKSPKMQEFQAVRFYKVNFIKAIANKFSDRGEKFFDEGKKEIGLIINELALELKSQDAKEFLESEKVQDFLKENAISNCKKTTKPKE